MRLWRRILAVLPALAAATAAFPAAVRASRRRKRVDVGRLHRRAGAEQDPRVADAWERIDGTGRRLLALRSYVRSRAHLADRWSWTSEQIAAYRGRRSIGELQQEIDRVNAPPLRAKTRTSSCG